MKVLQIHNFYDQFGGECQVVNGEKSLLERGGHEVIPFYLHSKQIEEWGVLQKSLIPPRTIFNFSIKRKLRNTLAGMSPDVAHVHNVFPLISPSIYYYLHQIGLPIVQTVHNYRFVCPNALLYTNEEICEACLVNNSFWPAIKKACFRNSRSLSALYAASVGLAWKSDAIAKIDLFIAISKFVGDKLVQGGIPAEKIRICGNFVESDDTSRLTSDKLDYILYLGRLSQEKGLRTLLEALALCPGIKCKIAGVGPLADELRRELQDRQLTHVEYVGFVSGRAKADLIEKALFTVVPSQWYENFPMSVVESLAHGTAVIASRTGGLPELIVDGVTGLLFEPGSINELAGHIKFIEKNRHVAVQMGKSARLGAIKKFGAERHLRELVAIYQEAAVKRDPGKDRPLNRIG